MMSAQLQWGVPAFIEQNSQFLKTVKKAINLARRHTLRAINTLEKKGILLFVAVVKLQVFLLTTPVPSFRRNLLTVTDFSRNRGIVYFSSQNLIKSPGLCKVQSMSQDWLLKVYDTRVLRHELLNLMKLRLDLIKRCRSCKEWVFWVVSLLESFAVDVEWTCDQGDWLKLGKQK